MLIDFSLDNASEMSEWDEFVESHPDGSPFHLSWWLRIIHETYAFKPLLFVDNVMKEQKWVPDNATHFRDDGAYFE